MQPPEPIEEPDPAFPDCFVCGEPFDERKGSYLFCSRHSEGVVRWNKYEFPTKELKESTHWNGWKVYYVDFTKPNAPGSPA
jgi:hypothetical protein